MKRLALLLCAMLVIGIAGTGALAKQGGNGKRRSYGNEERHGPPEWANRPEWAGSGDDDTEETETEETETEETETEETEEEGNGKAYGRKRDTPRAPADYIGLNKPGNSRHLYLYEKNPDDWSIVEDGAWGKMTYRPSGKTLRYVFTGHGLEPGVAYTLIYYPDPWPGDGLVCLGSATANPGGQVHIRDRVDEIDIPMDGDENAQSTEGEENDEDSKVGGKIWLVLSEDVDCEDDEDGTKMVAWNPTEYLFEYDLITFDDTDYTQETAETEESDATEGNGE